VSLIEVGRLGRPHGLKGEQALDPCTFSPLELHAMRSFTWRGADGATRQLTIATARRAHDRMLVRFRESHNRDDAAALTNGHVLVEEERLPDPGPGAAYTFQLVGCEVTTEEGRVVGTVAEVWPSPAHPVLVVRGAGEILIPSVPEFVRAVDLAARRVTVRLLPGMEEEVGREPDAAPR